jgi:hypothetical protein
VNGRQRRLISIANGVVIVGGIGSDDDGEEDVRRQRPQRLLRILELSVPNMSTFKCSYANDVGYGSATPTECLWIIIGTAQEIFIQIFH